MTEQAFPTVVSSMRSDKVATMVLMQMQLIHLKEPEKRPLACTWVFDEEKGLHVTSDPGLKKRYCLKYTQKGDVLVVRVRPDIPALPSSPIIRTIAHELLAMMKRGVVEWQDPHTGRACLNAFGMTPDLEKRARRRQNWLAQGGPTSRRNRHLFSRPLDALRSW